MPTYLHSKKVKYVRLFLYILSKNVKYANVFLFTNTLKYAYVCWLCNYVEIRSYLIQMHTKGKVTLNSGNLIKVQPLAMN